LPLWSAHSQRATSEASSRLYSPVRRSPLLEVAKSILLILSALFPIVNPLGGGSVFLALTLDYRCSMRPRRVAASRFTHFYAVDCPLPHRHLHLAFLWNLHSRSAGRRRSHRHF